MFLTILSRGFQIMAACIILALSAGAFVLFAMWAIVAFVDRNVPPPGQAATRATTYEEFLSCGRYSEESARFLVHTHASLRRDAKGAVRCD